MYAIATFRNLNVPKACKRTPGIEPAQSRGVLHGRLGIALIIGQLSKGQFSMLRRAVGLGYGSWWDTFIGNVLGRSGQMSHWHYTDPAMSCDGLGNNCSGNNSGWSDPSIWKLGYDPERWGMHPDPKTLSTIIRDGNYDFLTNSQKWHRTQSGFAMPNSLYLRAKPAFFGANPWPWVDPADGSLATLPAKPRFENGTNFCNSGC
jgi:hypothetical protein